MEEHWQKDRHGDAAWDESLEKCSSNALEMQTPDKDKGDHMNEIHRGGEMIGVITLEGTIQEVVNRRTSKPNRKQ